MSGQKKMTVDISMSAMLTTWSVEW